MKKIITRILLQILTIFIALQIVFPITNVLGLTIIEKHNELGKYYNYELEKYKVNPIIEDNNPKKTNNIIQINKNLDLTETEDTSDFVYEQALSENTTIYTSSEDENLKRIEFDSGIVNYESNGEYHPIDTTLQEDEYSYFNNTNMIESVFPNDINNNPISFKYKSLVVKYRPKLESISKPYKEESSIQYFYENNTNIRYVINNGIIKEDIIYNSLKNSNEIEYEINVENGKYKLLNNNIGIYDEFNNLVMGINAPKAYDSNNNETEIEVGLNGDTITYKIDYDWLNSEERAYPIIIDPEMVVYAHTAYDISAIYNNPTTTIGNPDVESVGWVLHDAIHAYMYIGNNPSYGDSYSYYKFKDVYVNEELMGKYIKKAEVYFPIKETNSANTLLGCNITGNYDVTNATYNNIPTNNVGSCTSKSFRPGDSRVTLDITNYIKDVVENGKANNGIMFMLEDSSKYLTLYASEHYYIDGANGQSGKYPGGYVEYYDNPDIANNMSINDFTYNLRPMVKYKYQEGAANFVALGIDGKAPVDSKVVLEIKESNNLIKNKEMFAYDNFYTYPNYPEIIDVPNKYTKLESNYQSDEFFDGFLENKVYELEFKAIKNNQESNIKNTWFKLYKVKGFDLINNIATFYGVDVNTLIEDNNLKDELLSEGNLLFIREPKRNKEKEYQSEDLRVDEKQKIDASLRGRNIECEYGFEPINFNTGSFLMESVDFSYIIGGKEYNFNRTYDSNNSDSLSQMGYGQAYNGYSYIVKK